MSPFPRTLALLPAIACLPTVPAAAAAPFDGAWLVVATVDDGGCTGPYRYPIVIRDGVVDDAGNTDADASGRAGKDGRITGTIRSGLANVAVEGRLRVGNGSGRWTLAGMASCSGRWTARKTG